MDNITVLISTSPRPTHPSPHILDQTILSLRASLPHAPIVIMCDGVPHTAGRDEMIAYSGFRDAIRGRYDNCKVLEFERWSQQSGMLERGMAEVRTPLLVYLEDDWAISPNVEWAALSDIIHSGFANCIRLYAYCRIHPLHEGMFFDRVIERGIPLIKTVQWSQNPHLASAEFYRAEVLPRCAGQVDAIENVMHGPVACGPWERWKVVVYNPIDEGSTQTVRHLDGRQPK